MSEIALREEILRELLFMETQYINDVGEEYDYVWLGTIACIINETFKSKTKEFKVMMSDTITQLWNDSSNICRCYREDEEISKEELYQYVELLEDTINIKLWVIGEAYNDLMLVIYNHTLI